MGASYGSVHVLSTDTELVRMAATALAKKGEHRFLIAPPDHGWTAVYPNNNGQDQKLAASLARRCKGVVVWTALFDEDVFAYAIWNDGKLIDQYNSDPDYFGEESVPRKRRLRGNPVSFAELVSSDATTIEECLCGGALQQLEKFGMALRLRGRQTAYEYLSDGETDGVHDFSEFQHVPDPAKERRRRSRVTEEFNEFLAQAGSEKTLLCDIAFSASGGRVQVLPRICRGTNPGEFFYVQSDHGIAEQTTPLIRLMPPYRSEEVVLTTTSTAYHITVSPNGRWLAIGHAAGNWNCEIFNLGTHKLAARVKQSRAVDFAEFSADETELFLISESQLTIVQLSDFTERHLRLISGSRTLVMDACGRHLVAGARESLQIIDRANGSTKEVAQPALSPATAEAMHFEREQFLRTMGWTSEQLENNAKQHRAMSALGISIFGRNDIASLAISHDGKFLACAGYHCLRIYDFASVRAAEDILPVPIHEVKSLFFEYRFRGQRTSSFGPIYDVALLRDRPLALFCENCGAIRSLNLLTGAVKTILKLPMPGRIWGFHVNADESSIAFGFLPGHENDARDGAVRLQIWSLNQLLE